MKLFSYFLTVALTTGWIFVGVDFCVAADISGFVYDDTGTPITYGGTVGVFGSPCYAGARDTDRVNGVSQINTVNGSYSIQGLASGTYYLRAMPDGQHVMEWWAESASDPDCNAAQSITVLLDDVIIERNFQLDLGDTISGRVNDSDGNPITDGGTLGVHELQCGNPMDGPIMVTDISTVDGSYSTQGLPVGQYYLEASSNGNHVPEWWADPKSVFDCNSNQSISLLAQESVTGKDFQLDHGATVNGTVYDNAGNPITIGSVYAYAVDPCVNSPLVGYSSLNTVDGTYSISKLPAGDFYLKTWVNDNYLSEWWADPASNSDCSLAQAINVPPAAVIIDKDFQLDPGATISGTVYDNEGVFVKGGVRVYAYTGDPCGVYNYINSSEIDSFDGSFVIPKLTTGEYFLKTWSSGNYTDDWWDDPSSSPDCSLAEPVNLSDGLSVFGKDFQLDPDNLTLYLLTTLVAPELSGTVDGGGTYVSGATVTLTANPTAGFAFTGWSGGATGTTTPVSVYMSGNTTVIANFDSINGEKKNNIVPILMLLRK